MRHIEVGITKNKAIHSTFRACYLICTFVGGLNVGRFVWQISDLALGTMAIINLTVLFLMRREIKHETKQCSESKKT
jgi:Na+/alanine symporter